METQQPPAPRYIAFARGKRVAGGTPRETVRAIKSLPADVLGEVIIFDSTTSEQVELDLRGSMAAALKRLPRDSIGRKAPVPEVAENARGAGRPKLGVVSREVTLLPRHWQWLGEQPGGASVALRKLIDQARRASLTSNRVRKARDAAYRFMHAVAGNEPGFEEAVRALFAGDDPKFAVLVAAWPRDIAEHAQRLASAADSSPTDADTRN